MATRSSGSGEDDGVSIEAVEERCCLGVFGHRLRRFRVFRGRLAAVAQRIGCLLFDREGVSPLGVASDSQQEQVSETLSIRINYCYSSFYENSS